MVKLGLLGSNISHSKSQQMYEKILGDPVDYTLLDFEDPKSIPPLKDLFADGFQGLSITYPFKRTFLEDVVIKDEKITRLDAINCLRLNNGIIEATNTDLLAARKLLNNFPADRNEVFVLGSGNMARVFEICLNEAGHSFMGLSRKLDGDLNKINYVELIEKKSDKKTPLIINCCSREFVFKAKVPQNTIFWDMNYSFPEHEETLSKNLKYLSGLDLLYWQASFAVDYWGINTL